MCLSVCGDVGEEERARRCTSVCSVPMCELVQKMNERTVVCISMYVSTEGRVHICRDVHAS